MKNTKRAHWSIDDVPWHEFEPSKVDDDIVEVIKAACLVERNADEYVRYLCAVLKEDTALHEKICQWGREEVQHGEALGAWAGMADPEFDFRESFRCFQQSYKLPVDVQSSVRGSRAGEMVSRCIIEIATSSFYSALRDATAEPVLKYICAQIAKDEFRHYTLFYTMLENTYRHECRFGIAERAFIAYRRIKEANDDELALAYYFGNMPDKWYDRHEASRAYAQRAFSYYRKDHVDRAVTLVLQAVGMPRHGILSTLVSRLAWRQLQRQLQAAA